MALEKIMVPDLEGSTDLEIVEIHISIGDSIAAENPLVSLESDKAVMDVPSPLSGVVKKINVASGDKVNTGDLIALVEVVTMETKSKKTMEPERGHNGNPDTEAKPEKQTSASPLPQSAVAENPVAHTTRDNQEAATIHHATPSVRAFARELGVDLDQIQATGSKGRITREDVRDLVKQTMQGIPTRETPAFQSPFSFSPVPATDYAAYGEIEIEDLGRIKQISGSHLHRSWVGIPHVTQFDEADITDLEMFRKELNAGQADRNQTKISLLIFVITAVARALGEYPDFNSSPGSDGKTIIRKKYCNIGIAVDTPDGLVVPVIRDADKKGIIELGEVLADLSSRAREKKLKMNEMKGGTFSISSLGGIGGTWFTPIVNAPEVAILGLSRSAIKPVWNGDEFKPRLMLPFSLSYDHRIIDGASAARFTACLSKLLSDMRRILL